MAKSVRTKQVRTVTANRVVDSVAERDLPVYDAGAQDKEDLEKSESPDA